MSGTLSRRRLLALGAAGLALGACATPPGAVDVVPSAVSHPLQGLTDFDGKPLTELPPIVGRGGTVVDFWASWCAPCRQSFRHLDRLYRTWLGRGLDLIAISVDDDPVAARRFSASFRPRFPLAWDSNAEVRERFGVVSLPTTVLLDGDGLIVVRNVGFTAGDHRYLEDQVRRLLDGT